MRGLLIALQDMDCRKQMAELFIEAGYNVIVTNSATNAISVIMKKSAQVVLLGSEFDALTAAELIPLLKQRNRNLPIILVSADASLPLIRKVRSEGIFYHALKPVDREDKEVIRRAVECAFEHLRQHKFHQAGLREKLLNNIIKKENARKGTRIILRTLAMLLVAVPNAFAATTAGSTAAAHWCSLLLAFLPWSLSSS